MKSGNSPREHRLVAALFLLASSAVTAQDAEKDTSFIVLDSRGAEAEVSAVTFTSFDGRTWAGGQDWISANKGRAALKIPATTILSLKRTKDDTKPWELVFTTGEREFVFLTARSIEGKVRIGTAHAPFTINTADLQSMWLKSGKAEEGIPGAALNPDLDRINLTSGDILSGSITTASYTIKTSYGELELAADNVASVEMDGGGGTRDVIKLRNMDQATGEVTTKSFEITLANGAKVTLRKEKVQRIVHATD